MLPAIAITGGAGFVGSNLAISFRQQFPETRIYAFDNLRRRGSEANLPRLRAAGVEFIHGDVRNAEDVSRIPGVDLLIDCAAEPSVYASVSGSPRELLNINLQGTMNCLEYVHSHKARFLFLSTSRVYPIVPLNDVPYIEQATRFEWTPDAPVVGISTEGLSESFPLAGARSLYGAAKLASELIIQEYAASLHVPAMINRCGIIAGPWQFGKVDQGVITLWMARHLWADHLKYIGFGGTGKQVRDVLHVDDLFDLIVKQIEQPATWDGTPFNVGGGMRNAVSLLELTALCEELTGRKISIDSQPQTHPLDVRIYQTDQRRVMEQFGWQPRRSVRQTLTDIQNCLQEHADLFRPLMT